MILRRIEGERFSEVLPLWKGQTVVVLGGGPSMTKELAYATRRLHTIAVNSAYLWAPWAAVLYFADSHWWRWQVDGIPYPGIGLSADQVRERFASFRGAKCTIKGAGGNVTDEAVHMVRNLHFPKHGEGLSTDRRFLITGRSSMFQSMNMAILAGARRVLLLGCDGRPAADGKSHFHGGHPRPTPDAFWPLMQQAFAAAAEAIRAAGVEIINCSPESAIDVFPKMRVEDALERS